MPRIVLLVIGAVIAPTLVWGVFHYRNCVEAAKSRTAALSPREEFNAYRRQLFGGTSEREKAIEGCSRLPF